jgi:multiple sugar transport system permease protein
MRGEPVDRRHRPESRTVFRHVVVTVLRYAVAALVTLAFLIPFLVMVSTSLKTPREAFGANLIPHQLYPQNFVQAFTAQPFARYLLNSLLLSGLTVLGTLISCPLVAYSLAKVRWWGAYPLLLLVLSTMMLPPQVTLIPVFIFWNHLGLTNSYWPLVVPSFLGTAFFIFLLRQFFMNIPEDLISASRLDGANELQTYWHVVLPLAKPALAAVAVFQFVWTWTDFLLPLIYLNDSNLYTLSLGLYSFFNEHGVDWGPLMAASVLFTTPALLVFLVAQKYFIQGISLTGLK